MPQADLLTFSPTLLFLPVCFLGGYAFFATWGAPRIILTLRCRDWATRWAALAVVDPTGGWPEIFLMFVQFGGLIFFLTRLTLVESHPGLTPLVLPTPREVHPRQWGLPVENFFLLWGAHREEFFFRPAGAELTQRVNLVLTQFGGYHPGRQFPRWGGQLRQRLNLALSAGDGF